ncbi:uncharacterized protein LOC106470582 [Limulus polyphemus]|uniref:Uncharacterized protein LOC106470582 n=1 Tax=Limulus polyphemus TaxID=6850 RepID=A0ABM1TGA0_LIMPO|nr:uncharacterized protein LOC106470582 [Limulus polyphemus]
MFRESLPVLVLWTFIVHCHSFQIPFFSSDNSRESFDKLCEQCVCPPSVFPEDLLYCSRRNVDNLPVGINFPSNLKTVVLNSNSLESINSGTFNSGNSVFHLDLSSNQIDFIAGDALNKLENLKSLDLSNNKIWSLSDHTFEKQSQLEILDLSSNRIQSFFDTALKSLKNLKTLKLNFNPLYTVQRDIFQYVPNLSELHLERTGLRGMPDDVFTFNTKLTVLKLSGNSLDDIPSKSLEVVTQLQHLDISRNPVKEIKPNAFKTLEKLIVLKIDSMSKLETIHPHAFHGLKRLEELHCSSNPLLANVHRDAFRRNDTGEVVHVKKIYLHRNRLETLSYSMLEWEKLEVFDVSNNPMRCDCRLQWMVRTSLPKNSKHAIRCGSPRKLEERPVSSLKEEDFVCGLELSTDIIIILTILSFVLVFMIVIIFAYVLYKWNYCLKPRAEMQRTYSRIKSNKNTVDLDWDHSADPCTFSVQIVAATTIMNNTKRSGALMLYIFLWIAFLTECNCDAGDLCKTCICEETNANIPNEQPMNVDCSGLNYTVVPSGALWPTKTISMNLSENAIHTINVLEQHLYLQRLYFASNNLKTIEPTAFDEFPELEELYLNDNVLGELHQDVFSNLAKLKILDLSSNNLSSLRENIFKELRKLKRLTLARNPIKYIQSDMFQPMKSLEFLDLSDIKAYHMTPGIFHNLLMLRVVNLSRNEFQEVPIGALRSASGLEEINLDENPIDRLDLKSFTGLDKVKLVSLSNMPKLEIIDKLAFSKLRRLEILRLHSNPHLETIHSLAFNEILDPKTLQMRLNEVNLRNNSLQTLYEYAIPWCKLKTLDLRDNPWRCDCKLKWIKYCNLTAEMSDLLL